MPAEKARPPAQPPIHSPEDRQLAMLKAGSVTVRGQLVRGSNATLLVRIEQEGAVLDAVYKPDRGERPLWDFPSGTLGKREAAAYQLSRTLGWELVPPTVYRRRRVPFGPGSLQYYFRHDPGIHYFNFPPRERERLLRVAVFDVLVNNADRKAGHILLDEDGRLRCIDHGLCFHPADKLRTVVWDFGGRAIPQTLLADLARLEGLLAAGQELERSLCVLLSAEEIGALRVRCRGILERQTLPRLDTGTRRVPFPPL